MTTKHGTGRAAVRYALASIAALATGCVVPYAYPHVSHVSGVFLERQPADVRAFRVDVTGEVIDMRESNECLLTAVPLSPGGSVPSQTGLSLDYGFYVIGIALNYPVHYGHSTLLRLYRPGYQLVEVRSWEAPGKVEWKPAPDPAAQEKAVDGLLAGPGTESPRAEFAYGRNADTLHSVRERGWCLRQLKLGSASAGHREALLFAAAEYERLAAALPANSPDGGAMKERLLGKAGDLRVWAAE